MKNRIQLLRKAKTLDASRSRVPRRRHRECFNAIEKGRFLPSIALAYNIAAALKYMSTRFSQPRAQLRVRCLNCPAPTTSSVPPPRVSPHLNRET